MPRRSVLRKRIQRAHVVPYQFVFDSSPTVDNRDMQAMLHLPGRLTVASGVHAHHRSDLRNLLGQAPLCVIPGLRVLVGV